jgi:hypothetical protein
MVGLVRITLRLLAHILHLAISMLRPARALATENMVLRRQLALYRERGIKPRRVDPATRASLAFLTRFIDWRGAVIVVRPETIDWVIPVSEAHLRPILREWVTHYNRARPHSALGPGIPDSPATLCGSRHGCTTRQRFSRGLFGRGQCWAGCTMSIRGRRNVIDRIIADHR